MHMGLDSNTWTWINSFLEKTGSSSLSSHWWPVALHLRVGLLKFFRQAVMLIGVAFT